LREGARRGKNINMIEESIKPNEATVPLLPCISAENTLEFFQALGFEVTWKQTKPYLYLALKMSGFELHFKNPPDGLDPTQERSGGCLIMVDSVAPYHAAFSQAMRAAYGKVLSKGCPRITRYRKGASRFSLIDPSGNTIIFIRRDEPAELEYGGSKNLKGLAKSLDSARIYREYKNDDQAAVRVITSALRRHGEHAPPIEQAIAYANLVELCITLEWPDKKEEWLGKLRAIPLTESEKERIEAEVGNLNLFGE
jgi:hypothetical protein